MAFGDKYQTYDPWAGGFHQYVEVPWMRSALQALIIYATVLTGIAGDHLALRKVIKPNDTDGWCSILCLIVLLAKFAT